MCSQQHYSERNVMPMDGKAMNKLQLVLVMKHCVWSLDTNAKKSVQLSATSSTDPKEAIYELISLLAVKNQSQTQAQPLHTCSFSGSAGLNKAGDIKPHKPPILKAIQGEFSAGLKQPQTQRCSGLACWMFSYQKRPICQKGFLNSLNELA